jgi:hypothetical protein
MPVVPPGFVFGGGALLFVPAVVAARLTDGWSLGLLVVLGVLLVVAGVQWITNYRGAWDRIETWQAGQSRPRLLAMNLSRSQPQGPAARILQGKLAVVFGGALIVVGVLGVVNAGAG